MKLHIGTAALALLFTLPLTTTEANAGGGHHHSGGYGHHSGGKYKKSKKSKHKQGQHHGGGWNHGGASDDCGPLPGEWDDPFGDWDLPEDDGNSSGCGKKGKNGKHGKKGKNGKKHGGQCNPQPDDAEGCTPGYWKNHPERWDNVGTDDFTISVKHQAAFNQFFGVTSELSGMLDTDTLLDAVYLGGGGLNALNRHAAAAAASADAPIDYAFSLNEVIDMYRDAVGMEDGPLGIYDAKKRLSKQNEKDCPLGNEDPDITPYCFGDEGDCPCGDSLTGGCPNTTGDGALLSGSGSTSVLLDDLVLTTTGLPQNAFAMTFMGPGPGNVPFGNGRLCASPNGAKLFRFLPAQNSGASGSIALGTGIVDMSEVNAFAGGNITVGSTWYFQTYYRDTGSACGSGYNLSNAVRVDFQP